MEIQKNQYRVISRGRGIVPTKLEGKVVSRKRENRGMMIVHEGVTKHLILQNGVFRDTLGNTYLV